MPKVLIADDSMAVRKVAERLLTQAGLEVALTASGEEALAWLANERPDLIISDVIMPGRSGYDVCKFVRSQTNLSGTPVLLISGIVNDEVTKQVEDCQADGVLKKPFQGSSLQDKVLDLLAKRQQRAPSAPPSAAPPPPIEAPPPPPPKFSLQQAEAVLAAAAPTLTPVESKPSRLPELDLTSTKVFRITEEKLQAFRLAVARVKELEAALAEEQAQSARLVEQLESTGQDGNRVRELEAKLAEEQQRSAQLAKRVTELEETLVKTQERMSQIIRLVQS